MDFSMPACVKKPEWAWFFAFAAMLLSAGCSGQADSGRFEVTQVEPSWASGRFHVISEQRLTLSSEARNALIHGVPLTVELELLLRDASEKTRVANNTSSYEIRYLPLSEHYQLALPGERKLMTFPRLRHVLAEAVPSWRRSFFPQQYVALSAPIPQVKSSPASNSSSLVPTSTPTGQALHSAPGEPGRQLGG